jgi:hypothetical protein
MAKCGGSASGRAPSRATGSLMSESVSAGQPPRPVGTPAEAEALIKHLLDVMETLLGMVADEIELVRTGKLAQADRLAQAKADMSRLYVADTKRIQANQTYLARAVPKSLADLRARHDAFRAILQMNLTVLASARVVSEGVMRGRSRELSRKSYPQPHGTPDRATTDAAAGMLPLTLRRVL